MPGSKGKINQKNIKNHIIKRFLDFARKEEAVKIWTRSVWNHWQKHLEENRKTFGSRTFGGICSTCDYWRPIKICKIQLSTNFFFDQPWKYKYSISQSSQGLKFVILIKRSPACYKIKDMVLCAWKLWCSRFSSRRWSWINQLRTPEIWRTEYFLSFGKDPICNLKISNATDELHYITSL